MEDFENSDFGCDKGSQLDTPFYTPCQKPMLPKSGLEPVNLDLSLSSGGDSSVASMKEGSGSPFSLTSDSEAGSSNPSVINSYGTPGNIDGKGQPEGIKLKDDFPDLEQQIHLIREGDPDNILWARENKSYDDLLRKFIKTEEELKVSNFKLQHSEEEIVELKIQIEKSECQLDDALKELEMKEDDDLLEWRNQTADLKEDDLPQEQLKVSNGENKSYDELLRKFIKTEEELKVSNLKLELSENEIINFKIQIEKSEGQLDNALKKLKIKEVDLEYKKGQVLELQNQTADSVTHFPDCFYKILKLVEHVDVAREQLKVSNDEKERLTEELRSRSSGAHELQGQLEVAQENVAALELQLDSGRKQIRELEDRITSYKANETDHELEVQKLKGEMLDAKAQLSLQKDQLHSDILSFSEVNLLLDTRLKEWESRNNELKSKLRQFESEKLKLEELHATQQMVLQGEISCLKEELDKGRHDVEAVNKEFDKHKQKYDMLMTERDGANDKIHKLEELHATQQMVLQSEISCLKEEFDQRRHDVEAVNKEFDRHKQKYDMLMTERDGANAKTHKLMSEVSFRDNQIANMEGELFRLRAQQAELISGSETRLNLVNELKLKVEELEKEVTRQHVVILDRAEEKREAIRQLCFSLEHYRSGYKELLRAFTGHKRHAFIAS